jgi:hypothetical protein
MIFSSIEFYQNGAQEVCKTRQVLIYARMVFIEAILAKCISTYRYYMKIVYLKFYPNGHKM